jgi:ATP-dependent helicase/nuclease subunit A
MEDRLSSSSFDLSEIVRAGAGAGKTRALTLQVMNQARNFLSREGYFPRVVVTTFTRKATQELRERLMRQALDSYPELIDFVNSRSHLVVSTIHGVLDLYLKRYGGNIAVDPSYKVIGRVEAARLARTALRGVLFSDVEHQAFLEVFDFKLLVRICRRYHELKLKDPSVQPHNLETLQQAFKDLSQDLAIDLSEVAESIKVEAQSSSNTQTQAWLDLAERFSAIAWGLSKVSWIQGREIAIEQLADLARKPTHSTKAPCVSDDTNEKASEALKMIKKYIESYDEKNWPDFAQTFSRFDTLAEQFSQKFSQMKMSQGVLEISDLELLAMDSVRRHPETSLAFANEWDYWLIDEYQDTSPFQVELLRELMGAKPCFIVGDPQQSIYLFRGARSEVFGQKEQEVLSGGGRQSFLTTNYRSRPELLTFFNDLFSQFKPPFQPMQANPEKSLDKAKEVATLFIAEKSADEDHELEAIVSHVDGLLQAGAKPDSICILARTHQTLAELAKRLAESQMPVHVHSSASFYDRREIQDALAILRFLMNPHDNFNLVELLRSPWFRVSDDNLVKNAVAPRESLWSALVSQTEQPDFEAVERLKRALSSRGAKGISIVFREVLVDSGLLDSAHRHDITGRREANLWKLIAKLSGEEGRPGFNPLEFVNNSLLELRDSESSEESDAIAAVEPNRINLMTVHASKGLAFDHVIVPRLQQRPRLTTHDEFLFDEERKRWSLRVPMGDERKATPSPAEALWLRTFQEQEKREHARVLYVALTRARSSIFLSWTEPVYEHSWAWDLKLDLTEGLHQHDSYCYRVLRHLDKVKVQMAAPPPVGVARPRWSDLQSHQSSDLKNLKSISVSEIIENRKITETETTAFSSWESSPISKRMAVASRGTAVHRLMEILKYQSGPQIPKLIQQWFPEEFTEVTRAVEWLGQVKEISFFALIKNGFVEWSFAFVEKDQLIEGQIDLWGRVPSTGDVWVIDYKTGSPEKREKAFEQMEIYARAISRSGATVTGEKIWLAAVYPFAEKIYIREARLILDPQAEK